MSKETLVIVIGLWVLVTPYLGVPRAWLTILLVLTALALLVVGFFLRAEALSRGPRHTRHHTFVESMPHGRHGDTPEENHERKERISSLN